MGKTWFEDGFEKGEQQGVEKERRRLLRTLMEARFGPLPAPVQERLQHWPAERLEPLITAVFKAQSLKEMGLED